MKIRKTLLFIISVVLVFACSGCSLDFFSVESLLSPPGQTGVYGEIQRDFKAFVNSNTLQFKTPSSGKYQTSVICTDLNSDGKDEAIVFYSDASSKKGSVRLALMEKAGKSWRVVTDIKGAGNGVWDVSFADLNRDGIIEIFINWSIMGTDTTKILSVYEYTPKGRNGSLSALANEYCDSYTCLDFNGDSKKDIVLVYLDDTGAVQQSYVRLFSFTDKMEVIKYSELLLDPSISSVVSITSDETHHNGEKITRVFIDCNKNDRYVFTELVYWDKGTSSIIKAFKTPAISTIRSKGVPCRDIDGDKLIEVPATQKLYGDENDFVLNSDDSTLNLTLVKWYDVAGDNHKSGGLTTLYEPVNNYLFKFPWGNKVTVYYDSLRKSVLFCKWNEKENERGEELFSLSCRNESTDNEIIGKLLFSDDRIVCYYDITDEGQAFGITDAMLISYFKKIN